MTQDFVLKPFSCGMFISIPDGDDITLCSNYKCYKRYTCRRFISKPLGRQNYLGWPNGYPSTPCSQFWDCRDLLKSRIYKNKIQDHAYFISLANANIHELCWRLAEIELKIEYLEQFKIPPKTEIETKAKYIYENTTNKISEIIWFIAEKEILYLCLLLVGLENSIKYFLTT